MVCQTYIFGGGCGGGRGGGGGRGEKGHWVDIKRVAEKSDTIFCDFSV